MNILCVHNYTLNMPTAGPPTQAKEEYQKTMVRLTEEKQQHEAAIAEYKLVRLFNTLASCIS